MYAIHLIEYARNLRQPLSALLSCAHNAGDVPLPFTYALLQGEGHVALIDVGDDERDPLTRAIHERDAIAHWQPPEVMLAELGARPEEVDAVLLTHAHFDHMDNLGAFPNATFYIQRREIEAYLSAVRDPLYRRVLGAIKPENLVEAQELIRAGRMRAVDGPVNDVLPGVDLVPMFDGHTFGSQVVLVRQGGEALAFIGDIAYLRESFDGIDGDGAYVPAGMASGSPYELVRQLDAIVRLVGGRKDNIILGHSMENWTRYETRRVGPLHISKIR